MKQLPFGVLPSGEQAHLYTISRGPMEAHISDFGATLVRLYVPDRESKLDDVVLGFADADQYRNSTTYFGATVGRNANRIGNAKFTLDNKEYLLPDNDSGNNLHSGPDSYAFRLWQVKNWQENSIRFGIYSPNGDQGFPGNAQIQVTYSLEPGGVLRITYDALSDRDTVFNLTNHSYFNLAGHQHPELAMEQVLSMGARHFTPSDAASIPTGELQPVEGTPFDFRMPKAIGRDIHCDSVFLAAQGGYDHNFEAFADPCAILSHAGTGRTMAVSTDRPGIQFYSGNYLDGELGKDGVTYCRRGGICLETQCYPDAVNNPQWEQPICKAGQRWHSETRYIFR